MTILVRANIAGLPNRGFKTFKAAFVALFCGIVLLWYKKPAAAGNHAYHTFHFKICRRRIEQLDIDGCTGTVPCQESVSNFSMRYRELLKWHC